MTNILPVFQLLMNNRPKWSQTSPSAPSNPPAIWSIRLVVTLIRYRMPEPKSASTRNDCPSMARPLGVCSFGDDSLRIIHPLRERHRLALVDHDHTAVAILAELADLRDIDPAIGPHHGRLRILDAADEWLEGRLGPGPAESDGEGADDGRQVK